MGWLPPFWGVRESTLIAAVEINLTAQEKRIFGSGEIPS
jgi:hypothetical protein